MPIIKVEWFEGRSPEVKAQVAAALEKLMIEQAGCPPGSTYIVFSDIKKENWASHGKLMG